MRIFSVLLLVFAYFTGDVIAATRPAGRNARGGAATTATSQTVAPQATSARAARVSPQASSGAKPVSARAARMPAQTSTGAKPVVAARAGTTQKVINKGTKVATAAKNIVVDEGCQEKYDGCMDSFCMLDNETGGRCICSDRNAELDSILAEIEKLDQQSYQMATFGVEKLEMGSLANDAIAAANAAADEVMNEKNEETKKARRALDLSMWDSPIEIEDEEVFFDAVAMSPVEGKEGDALHRAAAEICVAQIPECKNDLSMLQLMYAQRIKSDCAAYENSLKQQKTASQQKLNAAERALRETALEQLQTANKYDLGQCTIEFKKCMQTTGGCGDDFAGCASVSAMDSTSTRKSTSKKAKNHLIKGALTTIEISASTYDALVAKKPLCESVTKSCVAVADQVWDTFLREVAPQVKSAELIAEDNARQNCIGNISSCFQKACKDNMDPNDPDGSYDMCLSRPGTMLNVCKIPLNNCGIDATSESKASESIIWDFVVARLAAMRVDSCTTEVKECLQAEDRCGEDYTQCIGLDTDSIIRMCPYDKLTGCQKIYGEDDIRGDAVYDELATMVQGIMLNIDNNFMTECQNAANEAMIKVCGDTEDCSNLTVDENIGARSLDYKICEYTSSDTGLDISYAGCRTDISQIMDNELGRVAGSKTGELGPIKPFAGVLDGLIFWGSVEIGEDGRLSSVDEYISKANMNGISEKQKEAIKSELAILQKNIDTAINTIEADPKVQFCMTGREVQGMKTKNGTGKDATSIRTKIGEKGGDAARFPELTKQMRMIIANAALKRAQDNYYKKYDELNEKMLQDYAKMGERMAEIAGENALDARREIARIACISFADASSLPRSPNPPGNPFGKILATVAMVGAAVAIPLTGGASIAAAGALSGAAATAATTAGIVTSSVIGAAAIGTAAVGLASSGGGNPNGEDGGLQRDLIGSKQLNQWNYKEVITSTFEWETLKCNKCTRSQQCSKTKNPVFGSKYCKTWADPVEKCVITQF